jgi:hypothetical protein
MKSIILAAGQSQRFAEAGCPFPKALLPTPDGKYLIEWVIERLPKSEITVVVYEGFDKRIYPAVYPYSVLEVPPAVGPLQTLYHARKLLDAQSVLITYCDNLIDFRAFYEKSLGMDASMELFASREKRFTYFKGNAEGGVFYFKYGAELRRRMKPPFLPEDGIAKMVKTYEKKSFIFSNDHLDLGIPRDYKRWMAENGKPVSEW